MAKNLKPVLEFAQQILPGLISLVEDLFEAFGGDALAASRELEDHRANVRKRRAENDEALRKKYKT